MLSAISHYLPDLSAYSSAGKPEFDFQKEPLQGNGQQNNTANSATEELTEEEQAQVQKLKLRDAEVRAHEQAHLSAAGGIATSAASFSYQRGPNGQRYAIGGEVQIDTSAVAGDPAATLRKADIIKRAALAPASPSSQDYKVASQASSMATKAQADLLKMSQADANPDNNERKGSQFDQAA